MKPLHSYRKRKLLKRGASVTHTCILSTLLLSPFLLSGCDSDSVSVDSPPSLKSAPIADAGEDVAVEASPDIVSVQLDGSRSVDPDGNDLTYTWTIISQPECTITDCPIATLDDPSLVNPTLIDLQEPGAYVLGLTVNDGSFNSINDAQVTITLEKPLPQSSGLFAVALFTTGLLGIYGKRRKSQPRCKTKNNTAAM